MAEAFAILWARHPAELDDGTTATAAGKLACHVVAGFTGTTCVSATNAPLARARSGPLHDRAHQGTELDRVQRLWRGQRVRSWIAALTSATIAVQRVHRGVVARKLAAARRAGLLYTSDAADE